MSQRILGLDLGTNSIGLSIRDKDKGERLNEQIIYSTSVVFQSGSNGGTSFAAERTKNKQSRRQKTIHRRRLWATLDLLISEGLCPMAEESLKQWRTYYKDAPHRRYPIDDEAFDQWIKLDFDGDGKADYTSPYQLRCELAEHQFDFANVQDKYKLGRALYHIAQRRGFKSTKGEKASDNDSNDETEDFSSIDSLEAMKESEEKTSSKLKELMRANHLNTSGEAFALLEKTGVRIRASEYKTVRSLLIDEIRYIFTFQKQLSTESELYKRLISEEKSNGTIFYQCPPRHNKDLVGKCTLEANKFRCHTSHPAYEEFTALQLINNILYKESQDSKAHELPIDLKKSLYKDIFISTVSRDFKFAKIREYIQKKLGLQLEYNQDKRRQTVNYDDNHTVAGCPVTKRLINLFGDDWKSIKIKSNKQRKGHDAKFHTVSYNIDDILNICFFNVSNPEKMKDFAVNRLGWREDDENTKKLILLADSMTSQYGVLSLKALRSINRMLRLGLKYSDAVLLAKIPKIANIGETNFNSIKELYFNNILPSVNHKRFVVGIANRVIGQYKSLNQEDQYAYKDFGYKLQDGDYDEIRMVLINHIGQKEYDQMECSDKTNLIKEVGVYYQQFFSSLGRNYIKMPTASEELKAYLSTMFKDIPSGKWNKLYHHSKITRFKHQNDYLGTPNIGAIKNPVAIRTLNILRQEINRLIKQSLIYPDDTRVVVESARDLDDANVRAALNVYDDKRKSENEEIVKLLTEFLPKDQSLTKDHKEKLQDKVPLLRSALEQSEFERYDFSKRSYDIITDVKKYRLWKEQGCRSMYTGHTINLAALLDGQRYNIEHTLPLSRSFDNSGSNCTVCEAYYNQQIKGTRLPTELPNYDHDWKAPNGETYTAIKPRLQQWENRLANLNKQVEFWRKQAKRAITKDRKDYCIQQFHLWRLEADYWRRKIDTFKVTEITDGFVHRQLTDTRIISRYAVMYLKSLFKNVEMEKGEVTATFRKILHIQSPDEQKDRSNNAHHAIDATVLTLIPIAAKRDRMLRLYYSIQEGQEYGYETNYEKHLLKEEIGGLGIGPKPDEIRGYLEKNILVEHIKRRDALTPSYRYKVVKTDGKKKKKKILEKEVIRGQLHEETTYGAITQWKKADGKIMRDDNGKPIIDENLLYVTRVPLKYKSSSRDKGFKSWEDLEKVIVNQELIPMMKGQFPDGTSFKDACDKGIYMYKKAKNGEDRYIEKNKLNRINKVRCYVKNVKNPKRIKAQTYPSTKEYKNWYYAKGGEPYMLCEYGKSGKTEYRLFTLFNISNRRKLGLDDVPKSIQDAKGNTMLMNRSIRVGDTVLIYEREKSELHDLDNENLAKRLYFVKRLTFDNEEKNQIRITLQRNSFAGTIADSKKENTSSNEVSAKTIKDFNNLPIAIRSRISQIHFLLKDVDFTINVNENGKNDIDFTRSAYD